METPSNPKTEPLKSGDDNYDPNDTSRLTANPYNTFENKQTSQEAFKTAKSSVQMCIRDRSI